VIGGVTGGVGQLATQAIGVVATIGFSFLATMAILKVVDLLVGVRVSEEDEATGLDLSQHAEVGYTLAERGGSVAPTTITLPEAAVKGDAR
ncbi:MAG TPA: ammonia channel protein, partial [Actinomycetota bacterium]|nr:ammonia channel protein [Actinomycetota bacterium]